MINIKMQTIRPLLLAARKSNHQLACLCSTATDSALKVDFENEFARNHIEINPLQRTILAVGSSVVSLMNPRRGDMIACLGEVTGELSSRYVLNKMQQSEEGRQILRDRPRVLSSTIDLEKLKTFPEGTLGKAYSTFLEVNNVSPDSRDPVKFVDDINIAYVIQRYRDVHDLFHTLLGMPTNMLGEVTIKWVEAIQTTFPMCIGGALFGAVRLLPKQRLLYKQHYLPWAIDTGKSSKFFMNIYFEKRWEQQVDEIYEEMNIKKFTGPKTKKINKY